MPGIEQLVKNVTTDDNGERRVTWETQMVEENPVQVLETPIGIVILPLGKVFVNDKRGMPKHKLYTEDIIKTGSKSRVEIKILSGGEVDEKHIVRVGEQSEFVVTTDNLRLMGKSHGGNVKRGGIWVAAKAAFGTRDPNEPPHRLPTAVAAIAG